MTLSSKSDALKDLCERNIAVLERVENQHTELMKDSAQERNEIIEKYFSYIGERTKKPITIQYG